MTTAKERRAKLSTRVAEVTGKRYCSACALRKDAARGAFEVTGKGRGVRKWRCIDCTKHTRQTSWITGHKEATNNA